MKFKITDVSTADELIIFRVAEGKQSIEIVTEICQKLKQGFEKGKKANVEIKWFGEKRSLTANSYMWVLCDKIAKKLNQLGQIETKETRYRKAIQDIGVFEDLPIKETASDNFIKKWQSNGLGWICEVTRQSKMKGFVVIRAYYGSSSYNVKEMRDLVNYIIAECEELGIETMSPAELESLMEGWNEKQTK